VKAILVLACWLLCLAAGCRRAHQVGDHVLVEWRGGDYPAVIVGVEGSARLRVHFDGYSDDWDETLPATRVKARLSAQPNAIAARGQPMRAAHPSPSASTSARPATSTAPTSTALYHVGDRIRVEWHGSIYPASITELVGEDRYRIHYEGFGNEWDETIGAQRIQRKNN